MDHSEAIRTMAAEKYLLGEFTEEERSQYEEHFFDCDECAEDIRSGAVFVANAKQVLPQPVPGPAPTPVPRAGWLGLFWPTPIGAVASLVLALSGLAYQSLMIVPHLQREIAQADALQAVPWHPLSESRSESSPVITVSSGDRMVGLALSKSSDRAFPYFRCEVRDASGRTVLSKVVTVPLSGDELQILLPVAHLRPGAYVLIVTGLESPSGPTTAEDSAQYHFSLKQGERGER